ncbi:H-2 class II histocompatibility antigen, E-S beta chain-like [Thamnophis elegans]|uniref:H-2 class II histocompatibility antigen, E-S beta chain-like n=1 Tax=Thamnophis elegans TaxID=35005 RepID=UPI00137846BD|nr:H-2 class II histocompatibility antigen, E-S beta chain-like [Thamnophis elegans]
MEKVEVRVLKAEENNEHKDKKSVDIYGERIVVGNGKSGIWKGERDGQELYPRWPKSEENSSSAQSRPSDSASGAGGIGVFLLCLRGRLWGGIHGFCWTPPDAAGGGAGPDPRKRRGKETPAHFLYQTKHECRFLNGTQRVRYIYRDIYDRQEILSFDSDLGKFVAVTELGKADADYFNSDKQYLQYEKDAVDLFCRHNYEILQGGPVVGRRAKPTVTISPTKMEPDSPNIILLCTATGFYPVEIEIQWLKNGKPEKEGVAYGEELQNGDWTYQLMVMLETQPQRGDVYTCKVEHASLEAPITVQWEPRTSSSAKSKLWTGIMGAVIGVAFFAVGLFSYLRAKKAIPIQPPTALMN